MPMEAFDALRGLTAQLSSAATVDGIGRALLSAAKPFGFTNVLIVDTTKFVSRIGPAIVFASEERRVIDIFDAARPFALSHVYARAQASDRPFLMSHVRTLMDDPRGNGWWNSLPGDLQHKDGFVVPVHVDGELVWGASITGPDPDVSHAVQSVLCTAVHAAYDRFQELLDSNTASSPLSPRESECLRWIIEGKSDCEIGKVLEISPRTVRFHINNAKTKLGVSTRIQAVLKQAGGSP